MTARQRRALAAILSLCLVAVFAPAGAQVPGPQQRVGGLDIGIAVHFINRTLTTPETPSPYTVDFHLTEAFLRYGVSDWLTLSGEVAAANTHALEQLLNESNIDGRYLLVGAGAQACVFGWRSWKVSAGMHVARTGFLSREARFCSERYIEWLAEAHVERQFEMGAHRVSIWGGPSYGSFELDKDAGCDSWEWVSGDNWGGAAGVDAVWFARIGTFVHAVYAQRLQPRVGVSVHFE